MANKIVNLLYKTQRILNEQEVKHIDFGVYYKIVTITFNDGSVLVTDKFDSVSIGEVTENDNEDSDS